jgi:hypothetical protein
MFLANTATPAASYTVRGKWVWPGGQRSDAGRFVVAFRRQHADGLGAPFSEALLLVVKPKGSTSYDIFTRGIKEMRPRSTGAQERRAVLLQQLKPMIGDRLRPQCQSDFDAVLKIKH